MNIDLMQIMHSPPEELDNKCAIVRQNYYRVGTLDKVHLRKRNKEQSQCVCVEVFE